MASSPEVNTPTLMKLGGGTFGCQWCGKVSPAFVADLYRQKHHFMCAACAANTPPRGAEVFRGLPKWLGHALKAGFSGDVLVLSAENFLERRLQSVFDHAGHDVQQNLILEPYAKQTREFEEKIAVFAKRLGVGHSISVPSWHAPYWSDCLRITFFKPEVRA